MNGLGQDDSTDESALADFMSSSAFVTGVADTTPTDTTDYGTGPTASAGSGSSLTSFLNTLTGAFTAISGANAQNQIAVTQATTASKTMPILLLGGAALLVLLALR